MKTKPKYPDYVTNESERRMYDDFRAFLWVVWREIDLPEPTRCQYDIAEFLQNGPYRRMIQAFRGVGKTFITGAYIAWRLWRNPNERVLVVSANQDFAIEIMSFMKKLIYLLPVLSVLKPSSGQRDSALAFDVGPSVTDKSPSIKCAGILGQITGSRASIIIADDIEVPNNSETETKREKLSARTTEFADILKPGGQIIYLGTPQCEQSLYNGLPSKGYEVRIWPGLYPLEKDIDNYQGMLAPMLVADMEADESLREPQGVPCGGAPTDPKRFNIHEMMAKFAEKMTAGFTLQYMMDTTVSDAERYPLRQRDLIVTDVNTEIAPVRLVWASSAAQEIKGIDNLGLNGDRLYEPLFTSQDYKDYSSAIMTVDPSGRGADETAYCVIKMLGGMLFVRRWGGVEGGYEDNALKELIRIAKEEKVNKILVESNFGDGMFTALLKPHLAKADFKCGLDEYHVSGQKELRIIEKLEPVLNQHRLVMDKSCLISDVKTPKKIFSGIYQMTHITRERGALRHDDRLDVLAEAVGYFTERLKLDNETAEEQHKKREWDEFLKDHMRSALGESFAPKTNKKFNASKTTRKKLKRPRGRPRKAWGFN